jgi:hypothetical protein
MTRSPRTVQFLCAECGAKALRELSRRRRFCGVVCYKLFEAKRLADPAALAKRFWSKVMAGDPDACWEWGGSRTAKGYGGFFVTRTRKVMAQRVAYCLHAGVGLESLDGLVVMHKCDNPPCCNPSHLVLGSQSDNINDMFAKGRGVIRKGQLATRAKLSPSDVVAIRAAYAAGDGVVALGRRYGVHYSSIIGIVKRRYWGHVA